MTDRERPPARPPAPGRPAPPTDRAAKRDDDPSMSLTLTPRPPGRAATADHPTAPRPWPVRLLTGDLVPPPFAPAPLPPATRTPAGADAVSRALGCPDLFVFDAPDRANREHLIADYARAVALRGERVLVLSPDPAAADRLTELVGGDGLVKAVRALADDENPVRPNPVASRLASGAGGRDRVDGGRRAVEAELRAAEEDFAAAGALAEVAADLKELAARFVAIEPERAALAARRDGPAAELAVAVPGSAFAADLARIAAAAEAAAKPHVVDRDAIAARRQDAEAHLAALRSSKADPGKKTGFFARLFNAAKPPADPAELDRQIADGEREVADLSAREAAVQSQVDAIHARAAAEADTRTAAEADAVRADLAAALAKLAAERDELVGRFAARGKDLARGGVAAPAQLTPDAVARAAAEAAAKYAAAAARRTAAREKRDAAAEQTRAFLAAVRVVVGLPACRHADPAVAGAAFDVLVLDHAEDVGERDFADLSPHAARWVLAGDAADHPGRNGRRPGPLLARLARKLDRAAWGREGDRPVVRLTPDACGPFRREPVLDRPDVELRFAADGELAEIAFPPQTGAAEILRFLADQLGDVRLRGCGPVHWHDPLVACWPAADHGPTECVELPGGVTIQAAGGFVAAVAFDPAVWGRETAEAWLADRLGSPGRVASVR
jgi:hypothetical protein